jgi:hypothetical protein
MARKPSNGDEISAAASCAAHRAGLTPPRRFATIAGNGFSQTLGNPGQVGAFTGALIQICRWQSSRRNAVSTNLAMPPRRVERNERSSTTTARIVASSIANGGAESTQRTNVE